MPAPHKPHGAILSRLRGRPEEIFVHHKWRGTKKGAARITPPSLKRNFPQAWVRHPILPPCAQGLSAKPYRGHPLCFHLREAWLTTKRCAPDVFCTVAHASPLPCIYPPPILNFHKNILAHLQANGDRWGGWRARVIKGWREFSQHPIAAPCGEGHFGL